MTPKRTNQLEEGFCHEHGVTPVKTICIHCSSLRVIYLFLAGLFIGIGIGAIVRGWF